MEFAPMPVARPRLATALIGLAAAAFLVPQAGAQQVYRIVGPDGRVTFSDKPPVEANAKVAPTLALPGGGSTSAGLPFELRQVTSKYPVTLYSGNNCGPCGAGRAYLTSRGIPFTEKTISTGEDAEALQRMAGDNSLPLLTVGGQQIKGFSDAEWGQFLDAAGYPANSVLPASWRNPAPSPLVAVQRPSVAPAGEARGSAAAAPVAEGAAGGTTINTRRTPQRAPAAPNENPAGIQF
jgi:glutaredoxin